MKKHYLPTVLLLILCVVILDCAKGQAISLGDGLYQWDTIPNIAPTKHNAIAIDAANNKWIAMVRSGLYMYNSNSGIFINYNKINSLLPNDSVNNVYTAGSAIYACTNKGLAILDNGNWTIYNAQNSGLSGEKVLSVFKKENNLWVGTTKGLFLFDGVIWTPYLATDTINCILQTSNNVLWAGTNAGLKKYANNLWTVYDTSNTCIAANRIKSFIDDANGNLWLCIEHYSYQYYDKQGIYKLNIATNHMQMFSEVFPESELFPSHVYHFIKDNQNKIYFLISTDPNNSSVKLMFILDTNENYKIYELPFTLGSKNSIAIDAQKMVWITFPTAKRILYSFNQLEGKQWNRFYRYIDINNIRARINCDPIFFFDLQSSLFYEYPKNTGKHTIFSSDLWIGGLDSVKRCYAAAARYHGGGTDHRVGPILDSAHEHNYELVRNNWLHLWKLNAAEIQNHINNWNQMGYTPIDEILNWPAHGDTALGEPYYMAPFFDRNHDGKYIPRHGDYPLIKGDQAIYYVINTNAIHTETDGKTMKLEEQIMVYAYNSATSNALNNTVFVDYKIINKESFAYDSLFLGLFSDLDIGYASDDYVGSDVVRSTYYGYNGDDIDGFGRPTEYDVSPPAQAVTFLSHFMDGFMYFNNSSGPMGDPNGDAEYYNLLSNKWKGGQNMYYGGNGYPGSGAQANIPAKYMFPGLTDTANIGTNGIVPYNKNWREESANGGNPNPTGDRRGVGTVGPINFHPNDTIMLTVAYVTGRDTAGAWSSVENMLLYVDTIRNLYNTNTLPNIINNISSQHGNKEVALVANVYPNPCTDVLTVELLQPKDDGKISVYNIHGKRIIEKPISYKNQINLANQVDGIYFIRIESLKGIITKKVVKTTSW